MKVIVFGAKGMLGTELTRQLQANGNEVLAWDREELDITDKDAVLKQIENIKPEIIFNCAAYNAVDKAEADPAQAELAQKLNADAVGFIAGAAEAVGATLVQYSSGYVFDGKTSDGYAEDAQPNPQSVYGKTKLQGEEAAKKSTKHYIIRLNLLFGKSGVSEGSKKSFPEIISGLVQQGKKEMDFITDEISTPTYAKDLAQASIKLVTEKHPYGIYHLPNDGKASWLAYAQEIFKIKPADVKLNGISTQEFVAKNPAAARAARPQNSVLLNTKFPHLRPWQQALKEFLESN